MGYLRDAIEILSGRVTPTERDVYAGRLAEETDVEKKTVLTQLEARLRAKSRKAAKEREKALLGEGTAAQIKVPYTQGGQKALGVAFAEQQLMAAALKDPEHLKVIAARLTPERFITPEMAEVFQLLLQKRQRGEYVDFTQLSGELPEATVSLLSRILAQNYDVGFTERDVALYMERIEESVPKSAAAAGMSPQELEGYLEKLKQKRR